MSKENPKNLSIHAAMKLMRDGKCVQSASTQQHCKLIDHEDEKYVELIIVSEEKPPKVIDRELYPIDSFMQNKGADGHWFVEIAHPMAKVPAEANKP